MDEGVEDFALVFVVITPGGVGLAANDSGEHGGAVRSHFGFRVEFAAPFPNVVWRIVEADKEFVHDDVGGVIDDFGLGCAFAAMLANSNAFEKEAQVDPVFEQLAWAGIAYSGMDPVGPILARAEGGVAAFISGD